MTHTTEERWLPVVGHEDRYEVSDRGRVRSLEWLVPHRWGTLRKKAGKVLKPYYRKHGYAQVALWRDGRQRNVDVHGLVAAAFLGPRPEHLEVCHNDGNPANNVLSNLRYDTHASNAQDIVRHGRHQNVNKTHCPQGHEYSPTNTFRFKSDHGRRCRICHNETTRLYKARVRAVG